MLVAAEKLGGTGHTEVDSKLTLERNYALGKK